uniref:Photosystem II protein K n=1 Tax=Aphyllon californicum TaxID=271221 RepID=A0A097ZR85_9LAMI|nr:photosystem II protein K [Aphyllon californicum]
MLNTISFICSNSALYSSSFFFGKLPETYTFLNPIIDVMPVTPVLFFFFLSFCLASCCKFSMRSLI